MGADPDEHFFRRSMTRDRAMPTGPAGVESMIHDVGAAGAELWISATVAPPIYETEGGRIRGGLRVNCECAATRQHRQ